MLRDLCPRGSSWGFGHHGFTAVVPGLQNGSFSLGTSAKETTVSNYSKLPSKELQHLLTRISCMNMQYHDSACRHTVLRTILWSLEALGNLSAIEPFVHMSVVSFWRTRTITSLQLLRMLAYRFGCISDCGSLGNTILGAVHA